MADTSPGRATRTLVERFDCGNTAIAFHRIVVFEAAIELGRVREPLELSFDVKRLPEKGSMSNTFVILAFRVADGQTGTGCRVKRETNVTAQIFGVMKCPTLELPPQFRNAFSIMDTYIQR